MVGCGSDGVVAVDGGAATLNGTVVARCGDNGVLVQVRIRVDSERLGASERRLGASQRCGDNGVLVLLPGRGGGGLVSRSGRGPESRT